MKHLLLYHVPNNAYPAVVCRSTVRSMVSPTESRSNLLAHRSSEGKDRGGDGGGGSGCGVDDDDDDGGGDDDDTQL